MRKRYMDKVASKVGKASELVADVQTSRTLQFVERPVIDDEKINVLVMGASGAGKSTLINAVLGEEKAKVGDGAAVTKKMKVYERVDLPFRMIDTAGLEYSVLKQEKVRQELSGWSEKGLTREDMTKLIHVIWFCVDAQSKRLSNESLDYLYRISKLWKGVPIIVVFTKSFASAAIQDNEAMYKKVMKKYRKRKKLNVKAVVSVVAKKLVLDENYQVDAYGLEELTAATEELIPMAKDVNAQVMTNMSYKMRKDAAKKFVSAAQRSSFTVSFLRTKKADSEYLEPIQDGMLENIAKAYALTAEEKAAMLEGIESSKKLIVLGKAASRIALKIPLISGFIAYYVTGAIGDKAVKVAAKLNKARED